MLRALLGRYLRSDPRSLRFASGTHGKPVLLADQPRSTGDPDPHLERVEPGPAGLSFNISHSAALALYAFTEGEPVGVDVELVRRPIDEVAIAARAFGAAEAERLASLEPASREREFLRAWVRAEAELKCRGVGPRIGREGPNREDPWLWLAELDVGPRAAGAVALEHPPREVRCWDWRLQPSGVCASPSRGSSGPPSCPPPTR